MMISLLNVSNFTAFNSVDHSIATSAIGHSSRSGSTKSTTFLTITGCSATVAVAINRTTREKQSAYNSYESTTTNCK